VPFGRSISYGQLASRSGTSLPARGIGSVMAGNPLPLVVPCHRVLAANGLGGYSGGAPSNDGSVDPPAERSASGSSTASGGRTPYGLETKRWLLTFEQVLPPTLGWDPARPLESAWTTSAG
jgi:methylated-DNA-[protein]-cysteine S-methyltransferase